MTFSKLGAGCSSVPVRTAEEVPSLRSTSTASVASEYETVSCAGPPFTGSRAVAIVTRSGHERVLTVTAVEVSASALAREGVTVLPHR